MIPPASPHEVDTPVTDLWLLLVRASELFGAPACGETDRKTRPGDRTHYQRSRRYGGQQPLSHCLDCPLSVFAEWAIKQQN